MAGQAADQVNTYFELWLKDHNFAGFEKRKDGIYFPASGVLLDGDVYEAKELNGGKLYSVESRVSITFKSGRRLDDFVAGGGAKVEEAFYDSLQNFCLTTLHPIYAELFDHSDPHVRKAVWKVGGEQRRVFLSEWGQRGTTLAPDFQKQVERELAQEFAALRINPEIHWIKLVVLLTDGQVKQLVVTIDGMQDERLSHKLAALKWPMPKDFTMSKLFFVIGAAS